MIDADDRSTGNRGRLPAAAAGRAFAHPPLIKAVFGLAAMLIAGTAIDRPAAAADQHDFRICHGYYALCAASTCTPTGKTITVHVASGGTAKYPEVECTCPIESGDGIADVDGGNMRGSCAQPGPGALWSLYSPKKEIPQAINHWVTTGPAAQAPLLYCSKDFNLGSQIANCFSFACNNERYINGVPVASCYCPLGESLSGTMVAPHTGFVTQAGQGNYEYCAAHPVGGPISVP
ncbi:MAG: hypothetical protein ACREE2_18510 [Stellaceae bacterium]